MGTQVDVAPTSLRKGKDPEEYDVVILGGGTGSTVAAWTFAGEGKRVAVIDRKYIGGSCPNIACLPSKNIIHSAKVAEYVRRSEDYGITTEGLTIDMSAVRDRKRRMVSSLNEIYRENYEKTGGEFILASGRFVAPKTVEATLPDGTVRRLRGTNLIISTGRRKAAYAYRGAGTRRGSRTSAGDWRRLCGTGTRAGDAAVRKQGVVDRTQRTARVS
jgi:pyruvate/2-oxoglutarate dehydrogenase complex dihydrolipoamide dehydrogenase (E3) component